MTEINFNDLVEETESVTPIKVPPVKKKPSTNTKAKKQSTKQVDTDPDIDAIAATELARAEAEAEAERQAAAERRGAPDKGGPALPRTYRQRIRRAGLRPINVDLTIDDGAMLDWLADRHGSQRAAVTEAIRTLYDIEQAE